MRRAAPLLALLLLAAPGAGQDLPRVPLSPRASEEVAVGTGQVKVEYSRPFARGRKVFGGLVPWGTVWRTGANAATTLKTNVDLTLGGVPVPKGVYTLYTLPGEKSGENSWLTCNLVSVTVLGALVLTLRMANPRQLLLLDLA